MKILFLCHKMPYPPVDGGAIASLSMITEFAQQGHSVHVLAMQTPKHNFPINKLPKKHKQNISWQHVDVNTKISPIKALFNLLFSNKPYNASRFVSKHYTNKLIHILKQNTFDIIQLEGLYLAPYIANIKQNSKAKISLRAHNVEWLIWKRLSKNEPSILKSFYYKILAKRVKQMEHNALKKVDMLVPITEKDKEHLPLANNSKVFVSTTGIKNENTIKQNAPDSNTLFHIGALDWIPNQEGILWFINNVWLKLKQQFPEWDFVIAGRNAPAWFENKLNEFPVKYIGEVESAFEFIDKHKIMVVPLLAGSGMRIKIIEGMARSKCIVTTPVGAEGISVSENNIIIASNAEQMHKSISQLLPDHNKINNIGLEAYTFINTHYNNSKLIESLAKFYQKNLN